MHMEHMRISIIIIIIMMALCFFILLSSLFQSICFGRLGS